MSQAVTILHMGVCFISHVGQIKFACMVLYMLPFRRCSETFGNCDKHKFLNVELAGQLFERLEKYVLNASNIHYSCRGMCRV